MSIKPDIQLIPYDMEHYVDTFIKYLQINMPDDYQDFLADNASEAFIEATGYAMQFLGYMVNANLKQRFLKTLTTRKSAWLLGQLVNYNLTGASPSRVTLKFYLNSIHTKDIEIPAKTQCQVSGSSPIIFETDELATLNAGETYITIGATQGQTVLSEIMGQTTGVINQPLKSLRALLISTLEVYVGNVLWTKYDKKFDMSSNTKGYTVYPDENNYAIVTFGNGVFGQVPASGQDVKASYRYGGGISGNVGSNRITEILSNIYDIEVNLVSVSVTNESPATGGKEAETIDEAKVNIPYSVRSMDRLITEEDFLAIPSLFTDDNYGSIYKAVATAEYNWAEHLIKLYILTSGDGGEPVIPSDVLIDAVYDWAFDRMLPTIDLDVQSATITEVGFNGTVYYSQGQLANTIKTRVEETLEELFDYENRRIGQGLKLSDIYAFLSSALGVEWIDLTSPSINVEANNYEFLKLGTINFSYVRAT